MRISLGFISLAIIFAGLTMMFGPIVLLIIGFKFELGLLHVVLFFVGLAVLWLEAFVLQLGSSSEEVVEFSLNPLRSKDPKAYYVAIHEAGHCVAARKNGIKISDVQISTKERSGRVTYKFDESTLLSAEQRIEMDLAGIAAELSLRDFGALGSEPDHEKNQNLIVTAKSDLEHANMVVGGKADENIHQIFLNLKPRIDKVVRSLFGGRKNKELLNKLAMEIMRCRGWENVSSEEIERILDYAWEFPQWRHKASHAVFWDLKPSGPKYFPGWKNIFLGLSKDNKKRKKTIKGKKTTEKQTKKRRRKIGARPNLCDSEQRKTQCDRCGLWNKVEVALGFWVSDIDRETYAWTDTSQYISLSAQRCYYCDWLLCDTDELMYELGSGSVFGRREKPDTKYPLHKIWEGRPRRQRDYKEYFSRYFSWEAKKVSET